MRGVPSPELGVVSVVSDPTAEPPRAKIGLAYADTKPGIVAAASTPWATAWARIPFPYSKTTAPRSR